MKKRASAIDFTTGSIWKSLLLYFLPVLAGGLFQQLYATVDAVILGQFAGKAGLAAIDSIYNLLKLPVNFFTGLSAGAAIIISQCFGAKEEDALSKAVHTAVAFSMTGGLVLSAVCVAAAPLGVSFGAGVCTDLFCRAGRIHGLQYLRRNFAGGGGFPDTVLHFGSLRRGECGP